MKPWCWSHLWGIVPEVIDIDDHVISRTTSPLHYVTMYLRNFEIGSFKSIKLVVVSCCFPSRSVTMPRCFHTSSTAQGGGGSFKNRKPIGEVGGCESGMAERSHWWTERCLRSPLFLSLSLTIYLCIYVSMYLSIYLSICLSISLYLSIYLSVYLSSYLSICLSIYLSISPSIDLSIYCCCSCSCCGWCCCCCCCCCCRRS